MLSQLMVIAERIGWLQRPERTLSVARAVYLHLPDDRAQRQLESPHGLSETRRIGHPVSSTARREAQSQSGSV
jgi:hypothetical protein